GINAVFDPAKEILDLTRANLRPGKLERDDVAQSRLIMCQPFARTFRIAKDGSSLFQQPLITNQLFRFPLIDLSLNFSSMKRGTGHPEEVRQFLNGHIQRLLQVSHSAETKSGLNAPDLLMNRRNRLPSSYSCRCHICLT